MLEHTSTNFLFKNVLLFLNIRKFHILSILQSLIFSEIFLAVYNVVDDLDFYVR